MRLRGIDFGYALNASGARGFWGEGYWFHSLWKSWGLDYDGAAFVSKTTTLARRAGNMPLVDAIRPRELIPRCIVVKPWKAVVLNAVGLSGPGAAHILQRWSSAPGTLPRGPKMLSFMAVADTSFARREEFRHFVVLLLAHVPIGHPLRKDGLGLQLNVSCPNVGVDHRRIVAETYDMLDEAARLRMPVLVKVAATMPVEVAQVIAEHPQCDGLICSNTIPWGQLPDRIDWKGLFGSETSPLAEFGGGGLSGRPLLPIVADWISGARRSGIKKPIVGGGGVLCADDVDPIVRAGADAIEIGSAAILRPWRIASIIHRAIVLRADA